MRMAHTWRPATACLLELRPVRLHVDLVVPLDGRVIELVAGAPCNHATICSTL